MPNTTADAIMSREPVLCSEHDSLNVAAQRLWEHDIGALPVTDGGGKAIGMITDRDIAMAAYTQGRPLDQIEVHSAMSHQLWCVRPQAALTEVERLMQQHQVRRIAVVDDDRRPVGMISLNDLARRAGPSRNAQVGQDELAQTLRAVCLPRAAPRHEYAAAQ
jgi:CBS domain-containing protein